MLVQTFGIKTDMSIKQLLIVSLILIVATAFCPDENSKNTSCELMKYRLPANVMPIHYNIKLTSYFEENSSFDGESNIIIKIRHTTRNISLHSLELNINKAVIILSNKSAIYKAVEHNYDDETHILVLTFRNELEPGFYSLNMEFQGILSHNMNGFFRTSYENEKGNIT